MATSVATALLLETSDKTRGPDSIPAMRKAALALHELLRGRFPTAALHLLAFSYLAHEVPAKQLEQYTWPGGQPWAQGTNLQHALDVARDLLRTHDAAQREIVVLTAGVPTAYSSGGTVEFTYPPTAHTITETLRALTACAEEKIAVQLYVLARPSDTRTFGGVALVRDPGRDQQSARFTSQVEAAGHPVSHVTASELESAIIQDYLRRRGQTPQ
jgi:uncharacterized protein with von Willebrand factor type A (vWA) domain